ncbi:MAG: hypothetical protein V4721_10330 [Bacteroidota bacterium]
MKIDLFPHDTTRIVDAIEVDPCHYIDEHQKEVEVCEESEADFWSVYVHYQGGTVSCVADCQTKEDVYKAAEMLNHLLSCPDPNADTKRTEIELMKMYGNVYEDVVGYDLYEDMKKSGLPFTLDDIKKLTKEALKNNL